MKSSEGPFRSSRAAAESCGASPGRNTGARGVRQARCAVLAVALAWFGGCRPPADPTATLAIATDPPGAEIALDGRVCGVSPVVVRAPEPGSGIVTARLEGYQPAAAPVRIRPGREERIEIRLEPVDGLVLIETDPPGADVTVAGVYRGTAPLAVTEFPAGTHRVRLELAGHDPREIEVSLQDRTPQRHRVGLVSHLGILRIGSDPAGASVRLDGKPVGTTPLELRAVQEGERRVEVQSAGYRVETREVAVEAGKALDVNVTLQPSPGTLRVESMPPGALVRVEGFEEGIAPHEYADVDPGTYAVLLLLDGYADTTLDAVVRAGRLTVVRGEMQIVSGGIQIVTIPPGAQVFVDGRLVGTTEASKSDLISAPLLAERIPQGTHQVGVVKEGYHALTRWVRVEAGKTVVLQERLEKRWIAETEVELTGDIRYRGVIRQRYPDGALLMEVAPGVMKRIEAGKIVDVRPITEPADR